MQFTAKTIQELRKFKGIQMKDIQKTINVQTYYNIISGKHKPYQDTIIKFCDLFEIDEKTFDKLLKATLKNNK